MLEKLNCLVMILVACLWGCTGTKKHTQTDKLAVETETRATLQSSFRDDFLIGVAVDSNHIVESDTLAGLLIEKEFNSITPENDMKWEHLHPTENKYFFDLADDFVALGQKYKMHVVGHTLVWHSQLAPWMKSITDSLDMANHIEKHINTVVGRYKGKIDSWDVVNEALNEDGSPRSSVFFNVMGGEDYIELAFKTASEADPDAHLIYNDYNLWNPQKRNGVVRIVKKLQDKGIKIDGVGMQAHWSIDVPSLEDIEHSIVAYAELGVKVSFTELDVTVLPNPWELVGAAVEQSYESYEGDPKMNPYPDELSDEAKEKIANRYEAIFKLFLKHRDKIDRVTFWGLNDGQSWLNNWPIKGRTNYPLLFDRNYEPKAAYERVLNLKNQLD